MDLNQKQEKKQKVCIVEDDPAIQEMYKFKLLQEGYEIFVANDGEEGYEVIARERPDVALIDIGMPKMNGIELMKKLYDDPELSKIPVVVLTNYDDESVVNQTKGLQSRFYLVKALFTPSGVARIVKEVLH